MSSGFQVDGLVSGLKTGDIIASLMALERRPILALQEKQSKLQVRTDALKDVATRLTSLKSVLSKLTMYSTFNARTASTDTPSTSPTLVTATASSDAAIGSFKVRVEQLASSSIAASVTALGRPIDAAVALADAGFALTPTAGFFSVNGERITIDPETTTLDGGAGSVVDLINAQSGTTGVTASVVDNKLVLTSAAAIELGSGADTSNFLTAAKVLAAPDTLVGLDHQIVSTGGLGVALVDANLADARLSTALSSSTGSFKINGVEFDYDAAVDSLRGLMSRINLSTAGVNAAYDAQSDRLVLTARTTGSVSISVEDVSGNLLAATGVLDPAAQTLGQDARYSVDAGLGWQTYYSTSNTVSGTVPGVTLNLKKADPATAVTVTVEQDTAAAVGAVNAFVDQFNSTMSFIQEKTAYDAVNKSGGTLLGDSTIHQIESRLRTFLFGAIAGASGSYTKLADIGISTGAIGSAPGSTDTLRLDEAKLTAALRDNPMAVARVFYPERPTVALQEGGTGSIAAASIASTGTARIGTYEITSDGVGNLSVVFTPLGGSAESAVAGTIAAGGTNSTLIAGLVLRAKDPLVAGTDTVVVSAGDSIVSRLESYLDSLVGSDGTLTTRRESGEEQIDRLAKQIATKEDLLTEKEQRLVQRFTALEVALARLQSQSSQIASQIASLSSAEA